MLIVDLLMINVVYFFAYNFSVYLGKSMDDELSNHFIVVCNLIWIVCSSAHRLYTEDCVNHMEANYRGTWRTILLHALVFSTYLIFSKTDFSRTFIVVFYVTLCFLFALNRFLATLFQLSLLHRLKMVKQVAVMGLNDTGLQLASYFSGNKNLNYSGFLHTKSDHFLDEHGEISREVVIKFEEAISRGINEVYVALAPDRMNEMVALNRAAERYCLNLKFVPNLQGGDTRPFNISSLDNTFSVISFRTEPLNLLGARFKKRLFDIAFSSFVIIFILSWLYPIIALLIKMESRGPVLFKQLRSGRNNDQFWCFKFRSMVVNQESNAKQATKNDSRITKIGAFLRKTSLDELPQFFNVFLGEMSIVGPRPHMLRHTEEYSSLIEGFMLRHYLKPGITGWAQVSGYRGETKDISRMEKRVEHDIWYAQNWNAMLDIKIIFMTIYFCIAGDEHAH